MSTNCDLKKINLRGLASLSGYSISTVSKALNDNAEISNSTKAEIRRLALLYNYCPNHIARALRSQRTSNIAILFPEYNLHSYVEFLEGAEEEARSNNYRLFIQQFDLNQFRSKSSFGQIEGSIDGLILFVNDCQTNMKMRLEFGGLFKNNNMVLVPSRRDKKVENSHIYTKDYGKLACLDLIKKIRVEDTKLVVSPIFFN